MCRTRKLHRKLPVNIAIKSVVLALIEDITMLQTH